MKKLLTTMLAAMMVLSFTACAGSDSKAEGTTAASQNGTVAETTEASTGAELVTITVGASTTPHAEILEAVKDEMAAKGYNLEIVEFTDYVLPNMALEDGSIDANYFQHKPYLDSFNTENKTHLVSAAAIHYEPFGIYAGKTTDLAQLPDGATIAVPNDTSNEARALLLLEQEGLIKLSENVGLEATVNDIAENPHNYEIVELAAEQIARALPDVNVAVINGNYALAAGLSVGKDALATENSDSVAAETYANIVAVKEGNEKNEAIVALIEALQSETARTFIEEKYDGSVVPTF